MRNSSVGCFIGTLERVFRAREVRRLKQKDLWDQDMINNVIRMRQTDDWTVDRSEVKSGCCTPPTTPFEGARVQRVTTQDTEAHDATLEWNAIKNGKDRKHAQIDVAGESQQTTRAERLHRRQH